MSKRPPLAAPRPPSKTFPHSGWSAYAQGGWAAYGAGSVRLTKAPDRERLSDGVTGLSEDEEPQA